MRKADVLPPSTSISALCSKFLVCCGSHSDERSFSDEKQAWYMAPLGVIFLHETNDRYVVRSAGFAANQRREDDAMAESDIANSGVLE